MPIFAKKQYVKELRAAEDLPTFKDSFLIQSSVLGVDKNGKAFMNLVLMDKTGDIEARIWEDASKYAGQAVRDTYVIVEGRTQTYQGRKQVVVKKLEILREDEVDASLYFPEGHLDVEKLYAELVAFAESMRDPDYKALALAIVRDDEEITRRIKLAPAAKTIHHAYAGGLLEHVVSITRIMDFLARHYAPHVDRDLLFLGAFLHDIGKLWELSYDRLTDYTTEGRLIGHLVMGVELVEKKAPAEMPLAKKLLVKHLIVGHHGQLDYGSPCLPQTLDALLVHMVDNLDSKVNSVQRFVSNDASSNAWTGLHREMGRYFLKPGAPV